VYTVQRDAQGGRPAWVLEPAHETSGKYGTWMRQVDATDYRGKRVRITASVRTQGATRRVDFWARAQAKDSPGDGSGLGGDWQQLPPDSEWIEKEIVLDVPMKTDRIEYGVGVAGPGKVWLESAKVEAVGSDVPLTGAGAKTASGPPDAHKHRSRPEVRRMATPPGPFSFSSARCARPTRRRRYRSRATTARPPGATSASRRPADPARSPARASTRP
jgi:hypothetical protein